MHASGRLWLGAVVVAAGLTAGCGRRTAAHDATVADLLVVDAGGKAVAGASVQVWQCHDGPEGHSEGTVSESTTDGAGHVRLTRLDPGLAYRLEVTPPERRPDVALANVGTWKPKSETVRLEPGFSIHGVVKDPQGRSLENVAVERHSHVRLSDGTTITAEGVRIAEDGTFEVSHAPCGRVPLRALRRDAHYDEHDVAVAIATPQSPRVELVLAKDDESSRVVRRIEGMSVGRQAYLIRAAADDEGPDVPESPLDLPPGVEFPAEGVLIRVRPSLAVGADGTFRLEPTFDSLLSALWVPPLSPDDDLSLYVPEVGFSPSDAPLRLVRGQAIRGRVKGGRPDTPLHVFVTGPGGLEVPGTLDSTGAFVVRGLPEGRWPVVVVGGDPLAPRVVGRVEAMTGSDVDVEVR